MAEAQEMNIGAPKEIYSKDGKESFIFKEVNRNWRDDGGNLLTYSIKSSPNVSFMLDPWKVEVQYSKKGRPAPQSKLIQQGKYDCAPTAFAMLVGCSLYESKRAHAHAGWNNDERGCNSATSRRAARLLGFDLIGQQKWTGKPCLMTLASLNYGGRYHSVCWNGKELLDPNYGAKDRFFWGPEWTPWVLLPLWSEVLVESKLTEAERREIDLYNAEIQRRKNKVSAEALDRQFRKV